MAGTLHGRRTWQMTQDDDGYREYKLTHLVRTEDVNDGPFVVWNTPGLPTYGAPWDFGNELDPYAYKNHNREIRLHEEREGEGEVWAVTDTFTTKPRETCDEDEIDPLLRKDRISGDFHNYQVEGSFDRFDVPIRNSAFERIKGPQNEWDAGKPTVVVEQNVLNLDLFTLIFCIHKVNETSMWGFLSRCVKLSRISWERKFWGPGCYCYFTRRLEFDIDRDTFDRNILDEGTRVLQGDWSQDGTTYRIRNIGGVPADPTNPSHFMQFQDYRANQGTVVLNGAGLPAGARILTATGTGSGELATPGSFEVEYYLEADLLTLLGLPPTLDCDT